MKFHQALELHITESVAPKISGGLGAIEEELRLDEPSLSIVALAPEVITVDGWSISCFVNNRWYVRNRLIAEVRTVLADQSVDCIVSTSDTELFAGSVDEWWNMMFELLSHRIRQTQN